MNYISKENVQTATTLGKTNLENIVAEQKAKPFLDRTSEYMLSLAEMALDTLGGKDVDVDNHPFNAPYLKNLESLKRSQLK